MIANPQTDNTYCRVQEFKKEGSIIGLWIEFVGNELRFPSKNRKIVAFNRRTKKPFIRKDDKALKSIEALTWLYKSACKEKTFSFGDSLVSVICLIPPPASGNLYDSHNLNESIADWLQQIKVVNNDTQIEILCIKRTEYQPFNSFLKESGYPRFSDRHDALAIIIFPRTAQITEITQSYLLEIIKFSTGKLNLIG